MIKELSKQKPKRGAAFTHPEHGQVFLDRIKEDGTYFVQVGYGFLVVDPNELRPATKLRKPIGNSKKAPTQEEKRFKADLNIFYAEALNELPDNCMECNEPLGCLSAWDARCCTAHILEKNEKAFLSIACHPANKMFLGKKNCCCHDRYDKKGAAFRSSMKIYPTIILPAFEILKLELSEHDIIRAKKYLNIKT